MSRTKTEQPCWSNSLLWLGMLGPAALWLIYLEVAYLLVHLARKTGNHVPLHVASVAFLLVTLVLGLIAWAQWRRVPRASNQFDERTVARAKFMGLLGILSTVEFTLIIVGSWIAMFFINPSQW